MLYYLIDEPLLHKQEEKSYNEFILILPAAVIHLYINNRWQLPVLAVGVVKAVQCAVQRQVGVMRNLHEIQEELCGMAMYNDSRHMCFPTTMRSTLEKSHKCVCYSNIKSLMVDYFSYQCW